MDPAIRPSEPNFDVLVNFLQDELERVDADRRAIHLASQRSFATWAETVLGTAAERLGLTLGFLAGWITAAYTEVRDSFKKGWRAGYDRGRGL